MQTTDLYDLWSSSYDELDNPMIAMCEHALDRLPLRANGMNVVELGCGTGRNLGRVIREGAASYLGVDGSAGMLAKTPFHTRASWQRADLTTSAEIAPASADIVLVTLVLEHFADLSGVLSLAARTLAPGGHLRILEIHPTLVRGGTQAHFWHQGQEVPLEAHPHDADEYRRVAHEAGLLVGSLTEWAPDASAVSRSPKLAKRTGQPVLLDLELALTPRS